MQAALRKTEVIEQQSAGIDARPDAEILAALFSGQQRALAAVEKALPAIAKAAEEVTARLKSGGKLYYAGAGTSIRIGVQDGTELPATYGIAEAQLGYLIAGGTAAIFETLADKEDSIEDGRTAAAICTKKDALVAIAASGRTPFTTAAAEEAHSRGAFVIGVSNVAHSPLGHLADVDITLDTGPEIIAGSTRMGAGTAQKAALNLMSTLVGIKLGAVHDGMMVNMQAGNAKLKERAARIVSEITGADHGTAVAALNKTGAIKPAVLVCSGTTPQEAEKLLAANDGNLRKALAQLPPQLKLQH